VVLRLRVEYGKRWQVGKTLHGGYASQVEEGVELFGCGWWNLGGLEAGKRFDQRSI